MKNKILLIGFIGVFAACTTKVETKTIDPGDSEQAKQTKTVNKDSVKTVIQDMENTYAKSMAAKNIDGIMPYYGDDIMSIDGGNDPISGKDNLKKSIVAQLAKMPANSKISMEAKDVTVSDDGGMVSETGMYSMNDSMGTNMASGYYATVFQKKDGKYQCIREVISPTKKETAADKKQ